MKASTKDFWMEIKKSKARFISIFFIVALGVAFFSGIQAASPDMRFSGDEYYDETKLMDLKVVGTLGLTDEDIQALMDVDGVELAEGAYSTDVMCGTGETQKVLHIEAINENVNQLTVSEGRLPQKSGELFLDSIFADGQDYQVGDTISLTQEDDSSLLLTEAYTIVGIGRSPMYISYNRGNTTLGSGEINGFAYVCPEDFDQEVYTQIYLMVHGAKNLTSYTDGYDNLIDKIQKRVEALEGKQCQLRYETVVTEATEKLEDAKEELEDGRKEAAEKLADAKKELEDGQKQYEDGKQEYKDGKTQLADAKKELEDGKTQLADAKKEVEDGWSQLSDAKNQLASGRAQLESAKEQLDAGWAEINEKQSELDAGSAKLEEAKKQLEDGKNTIAASRSQLEEKQKEIDAGKAAITQGRQTIADTRADLLTKQQQCQDGLAKVEAGEAQLPAAQAQVDELSSQLAALQEQYEQAQDPDSGVTQEELDALAAQVEELTGVRDAAAAQLEAQRQTLAATRSELETSLTSIATGLTTLEQQETALAAQEEQLAAGQTQIDQGLAKLTQEEAKFAPAEKEIQKQEATIAAGQAQIDAGKETLYAGQAEIDANEETVASGEAQIAENTAKLTSGEQEIKDNEQKLIDGEKEIKDNEQKLADAKKELQDGAQDLKDGKQKYKDAKKEAEDEIADGEKKIQDAQKEIDDLKTPEWMVTDRNDLPEYSDYGDNAERIRNIGHVFPVIFFLVAALISLTTMTRMVEEQRIQIGTRKALGYGKYAIAFKYLGYAFLATVGGSILGVLVGEKILPYIIIKAYGIMYNNVSGTIHIQYEWKFALIASCAAIFCTMGATIFSCYTALAETPASLMRPPSPKEGKRVLIERIGFLWKHLSFTWKSTLRNMFRYKKRLFMTVFGIAGSMGLMLVGFGLQDSIMDIAVRQYANLQHYDGTIIDDEDATDAQREKLANYLAQNDKISRYTGVQLSKMEAPRGKSHLSVYVYVPENLDNFSQDVTLQSRRTGEQYTLSDEGAAICEKTASLLGISLGDEITLKKDNQDYKVKVTIITENYMGHYVYLTSALYEEVFGEKPDFSSTVFTMKEEYKDQVEDVGNEILQYPAALSISYTSSIAGQLERMLSSLGTVIVVLIISAGMLAFVVLYNLNNINITERQRELATLKVLGFYDGEVSQYVFRENILLTLVGVVAGAFFGMFLHYFVITTVEVDAVMFGRNIKPLSFVYSGLFTCGFSAVVNLAMHFKLKKIDMVESLKSVE